MKHMRKWRLVICALLTQSILFGQQVPPISIPDNAQLVMHIDFGRLGKKLPWSSITQRDFFQYILGDMPQSMRKMAESPAETGVDFNSGLWIAVYMNPKDPDDPANFFLVSGLLSDQAKFLSMLKSGEKQFSVTEMANAHFILEKDFGLAWNSKQFVFRVSPGEKEKGKNKAEKRMSKSASTTLIKQLTSLLTVENNYGLMADKRFLYLMRQQSDIRIWSNGKLNLSKKGKPKAFNDLDWEMINKDTRKATLIDFENGKIVSRTMQWPGDSLAPFLKNMYGKKMNTALLQKVPAGNPLMVMNFSMNMKGIEQFMNHNGMGQIVNGALKKADFQLEDFSEALMGDILMVVNIPDKPKEPNGEAEEVNRNPFSDIQIFIAATVKDEKKMNRLVDTLRLYIAREKSKKDSLRAAQVMGNGEWSIDTSYEITKEEYVDTVAVTDTTDIEVKEIDDEGIAYPAPPPAKKMDFNPVMEIKDGIFVMSFSEESLKAFQENKSNPALKEFGEKYGNLPMAMSLDMKTVMSFLGPILSGKMGRTSEDGPMAVLDLFDKLTVTGGDFKDNAILSEVELKFSDPSLNSLEILVNIIEMSGSKIKELAEAKKDEERPSVTDEEGVKEEVLFTPPAIVMDEPEIPLATYPGGEKAWSKYLKKNLDLKVPLQYKAPKGVYEVEVEFIVKANGVAEDFISMTNHGYGMEEEAIRVLATVEKWKPVEIDGKPVDTLVKQKITFNISN